MLFWILLPSDYRLTQFVLRQSSGSLQIPTNQILSQQSSAPWYNYSDLRLPKIQAVNGDPGVKGQQHLAFQARLRLSLVAPPVLVHSEELSFVLLDGWAKHMTVVLGVCIFISKRTGVGAHRPALKIL